MTKIKVASGIEMPFFPMRPTMGKRISGKREVKTIFEKLESGLWSAQPKLNGDRVCLAVLDGAIYVQNRHGSWYGFRVRNADDFLKCPNKSVFDGECVGGIFYPFEALAICGQSLIFSSFAEREVIAFQTCKLLRLSWLYSQPSKNFFTDRHGKSIEGVVLKRKLSRYTPSGSVNQCSPDWFKQKWN